MGADDVGRRASVRYACMCAGICVREQRAQRAYDFPAEKRKLCIWSIRQRFCCSDTALRCM